MAEEGEEEEKACSRREEEAQEMAERRPVEGDNKEAGLVGR